MAKANFESTTIAVDSFDGVKMPPLIEPREEDPPFWLRQLQATREQSIGESVNAINVETTTAKVTVIPNS